jgi:hypothetical protein
MKPKPLFIISAVIAALALAALACGGGGAATSTPEPPTKAPPTEGPEPTDTPKPAPKPTSAGVAAGEVGVVSQSMFQDSVGYYHFVGEIKNDTEKPVTDVELTLEVRDADGNTLLKDGDTPVDSLTFSPLLFTLAPGQYSPFDYYIFVEDTEPAEFSVTVTGQETGDVNRGTLEMENDQLVSDNSGNLYLAGELVNKGDNPVQIHGLAGAVMDDQDAVLAANAFGPYSRFLFPAGDAEGYDRTPFRIRIDDPGVDIATYTVYWDADEVDPLDTFDIDLEPQNNYFDTFDSFHLVGLVMNHSDEVLSVSLVAGIYDDDGVVLDADTTTIPVYLSPGDSLPYSFDYFSSINSNADEAKRASSTVVQVDPYRTSPTSFEFVNLESENDAGNSDGDEIWRFTGDVTNTSDQELSSMVVVVAVYDGDTVVGSTWGSIYPPDGAESIRPGDTVSYDITLYLDPSTDGTQFEFATFVQGYVR